MGERASTFPSITVLLACTVLGLGGCASGGSAGPSDERIREQVQSALRSASDVPGSQLAVEVRDGVVTLTGSTACESCGGRATPGGDGTVEQSIGAIVRAVPGVRSIHFATRREP